MMGLGVLLLILSTCGGIGLVMSIVGGGPQTVPASVFGLIFWMAPGIGYIVCSVHLKRYKAWAAIVGLVLTGLALMAAVLMFGALLIVALTSGAGSTEFLFALIPLLFIAAFAQLIVHLSRSFKAIRIHEMEVPQGYGFQPILTQPGFPRPHAETQASLPTGSPHLSDSVRPK